MTADLAKVDATLTHLAEATVEAKQLGLNTYAQLHYSIADEYLDARLELTKGKP